MGSKIWTKESNRYTSRAIESHEGELYLEDNSFVEKISNCISLCINDLKTILDIGCAYGGTAFYLKDQFKGECFYGIDPGAESIKIANNNLGSDRVQFKQGYSHDLTYSDNMFDVVIFSMILQWMPRNKLIKTISEVDRVLRTGG
jgi:ubiquinone/menaquinone biosynthesis C-methylase UbiE